jgi:hypothetical protein
MYWNQMNDCGSPAPSFAATKSRATTSSGNAHRILALLALLISVLATTLASAGVANAADSSTNPLVTLVPTKSGAGYWQVASDGAVYSYGDARYLGGANGVRLRQPIVGATRHPGGGGYWLVGADGGVFSYGDAKFFGSAAEIRLNEPVVGMASTPSGNGYWLVAADGGVFAYGDAKFFGSAGSIKLNKPVVGMSGSPTGNGYWLVAADGGIFAYGDARFSGSAGSIKLNQPIVGMASTPTGDGYWLVALDGGVFAYGGSKFHGRVTYSPPPRTGYTYILPSNAAKSSLTAPHHDYPALDVSVVTGTQFYAITGGRVTQVNQPNGCGLGYILQGNDGVQYTYCHASKHVVASGALVTSGQQLGLTGNTGHSTGPHLHLQIRYSGLRCPQNLVSALRDKRPAPAVGDLPTGGCIS